MSKNSQLTKEITAVIEQYTTNSEEFFNVVTKIEDEMFWQLRDVIEERRQTQANFGFQQQERLIFEACQRWDNLVHQVLTNNSIGPVFPLYKGAMFIRAISVFSLGGHSRFGYKALATKLLYADNKAVQGFLDSLNLEGKISHEKDLLIQIQQDLDVILSSETEDTLFNSPQLFERFRTMHKRIRELNNPKVTANVFYQIGQKFGSIKIPSN